MFNILKTLSFFQDMLAISKAISNKCIFHISTYDQIFIKVDNERKVKSKSKAKKIYFL